MTYQRIAVTFLALSISNALVSLRSFAKTNTAAQVLEESYTISQRLPNEERAFYLVRLIDISTSISPNRTEAWSKELRELAPKLPKTWDRVAIEKNALVPLSRINPVSAFEKLALVEPPIPGPDGLTEDVRSDAAATIYPNYFKMVGIPGVDVIVQRADELGKSGEYPYRAMGLIIENLVRARASAERSADIFKRAVAFYTHGSGYLDENPEFFELLQSSRSAVPDDLYKTALREFAKHLTSNASQEPRNFLTFARTADGQYSFTSEKLFLLFRIFPSIVHLDRALASELVQKYPILAHSDPEVTDISSSAVLRDLPQEQVAQLNDQMQQAFLAKKVEYLQGSDPSAALREAQLLTDEVARTNALVSVVHGLMRTDPGQAKAVYDQLVDHANRLPEGEIRLHALVNAAKAAYYSQDPAGFSDLTGQAFESGLEVFKAGDTRLTKNGKGYSDLIGMAEFAAEHGGGSVLSIIRKIQGDGLRAYLLLYAAKGLRNAEITLNTVASK